MAETNTRQASRAPVTLKIKFKSETLAQFIERYSVDISHGGIFIRTKDPLAVGTSLKFEFQLKDATPLIAGEGTVVWTREPDAKRAGVSPGMGVRFDKLPSESQKVLDAVLAQKGGKLTSEVEPPQEDDDDAVGDFVDSPTRVAPAGLVDSLVGANDYDDGDLTPLPKPMPFHGDVDDFSDDAFNESTKVASVDKILAQAKDSAETDESAYDEDAVFASTSGPIPVSTSKPEKAVAPAQDYEDPFADLNDAAEERSVASPAVSTSTDTSDALAADASGNIITSTAERVTDADADADADPTQSSAEDAQVDDAQVDKADDAAGADENNGSDENDQLDENDQDDQELGDDELGGDDDKSAAEAKSKPSPAGTARAAILDSAGDEEPGSSMPWIAVAAVILLIGGVGGFWLLNKRDKDDRVAPAANSTLPAATEPSRLPDTVETPSEKPEIVEAPTVITKPVAITTVPDGARLTVEGTELHAISPATFELEAGKTYTVQVQHAAFLSQSIEVNADDSEVEPITLAAKAKLLRITSQPPGAIVLVNGQRLRGHTPVDLPVSAKMTGMPSVRVQLRLPGYQAIDTRVPMNEGFEPTETQLISNFTAELKPFAARPNPQKNTNAEGKSGSKSDSTGTVDKATVKGSTEPTKTEPTKTEPTKTEPTKTEPVKTDTKQDAKSPGASEPTPEWMK